MNWEAFVTCAVTGAGDTTGKSDRVPVSPAQIADAAIEAARAGAAIAHIHVRDETGRGSRDVALYREVVERVRASDVDVVINLTAGMGGDLVLGGAETPLPADPGGTDLVGARERLAHVEALLPEICTLDCGTMNFAAGGDYIMVNSPAMLKAMARHVQELGVRPELEVFDTGHLVFVKELLREGLLDDPTLIQLCTGIPYGAPDDPGTLLAMVNQLPPGAIFSAFSIGRMQLPFAAMAVLAGGNVRVGLEDNLYLERGRLASNGELVERAVAILQAMNVRVLGPDEVRTRLRLREAGLIVAGREHVGLLGGGVIGGGWAARFLLNGSDVRLFDPDPEAPRKVGEVLDNARRALGRLTLAPLPGEGALTFVASAEEAAAGASFVQESAPERMELKQRLLAAASRAAGPEAVLASSTSGLPAERARARRRAPRAARRRPPLQSGLPAAARRGRAGRAHLGPRRGARGRGLPRARHAALAAAARGRRLRRRPPLEALWREALWLVNDGVATTEEIDDAIRFGAGLRWSFMGTFLTYRIAGGEAGMRHFMAQFGPALQWPWSRLTDVPELTDELLDRLVAQSDARAAGRSIRELERLRDDCLVAVLQGLRAQGFGAGEVLDRYERLLFERAPAPAAPADAAGPLRLHETRIRPEWVDYNGHMHESRYLQVLGDAADAFFRHVGIDAAYLEGTGNYFTVETHLRFLREVGAGEAVHVETRVLGADEKRLHLWGELVRSADGELLATAEQMNVHVSAQTRRSGPVGEEVLRRVSAVAAAHASAAAARGRGPRDRAAGGLGLRALAQEQPAGGSGRDLADGRRLEQVVDAERRDEEACEQRAEGHRGRVERDRDREDAAVEVVLDGALADPEHRDDPGREHEAGDRHRRHARRERAGAGEGEERQREQEGGERHVRRVRAGRAASPVGEAARDGADRECRPEPADGAGRVAERVARPERQADREHAEAEPGERHHDHRGAQLAVPEDGREAAPHRGERALLAAGEAVRLLHPRRRDAGGERDRGLEDDRLAAPGERDDGAGRGGPERRGDVVRDAVRRVRRRPEALGHERRHERAEADDRQRERHAEAAEEEQVDGDRDVARLPGRDDGEEEGGPRRLRRDDEAGAGRRAVEPRAEEGPRDDPRDELGHRAERGDDGAVGALEQVDDEGHLAHRDGGARERHRGQERRVAGHAQERAVAVRAGQGARHQAPSGRAAVRSSRSSRLDLEPERGDVQAPVGVGRHRVAGVPLDDVGDPRLAEVGGEDVRPRHPGRADPAAQGVGVGVHDVLRQELEAVDREGRAAEQRGVRVARGEEPGEAEPRGVAGVRRGRERRAGRTRRALRSCRRRAASRGSARPARAPGGSRRARGRAPRRPSGAR